MQFITNYWLKPYKIYSHYSCALSLCLTFVLYMPIFLSSIDLLLFSFVMIDRYIYRLSTVCIDKLSMNTICAFILSIWHDSLVWLHIISVIIIGFSAITYIYTLIHVMNHSNRLLSIFLLSHSCWFSALFPFSIFNYGLYRAVCLQ